MREEFLHYLRCPHTAQQFELIVLDRESDGHVETGVLRTLSGTAYPVVGGIPRFLPDAWEAFVRELWPFRLQLSGFVKIAQKLPRKVRRTRASFSVQWEKLKTSQLDEAHYPNARLFANSLGFEENDSFLTTILEGKSFLDAGCGVGRYTLQALRYGATVIAIDLSPVGCEVTYRHTRANPLCLVIQGDLLHPPFAPETFDWVYAVGVLHHTADVHCAFNHMCRLARPGGRMVVGVYWKYKRYRFYEKMRKVTIHLPPRLLYWMIQGLIPLSYLPGLGDFFYPWFQPQDRWSRRVGGCFDHMHPTYQSYHDPEEIKGWFKQVHPPFDDPVMTYPFNSLVAKKCGNSSDPK